MQSPRGRKWTPKRLNDAALQARLERELATTGAGAGGAKLLRELAAYVAELEARIATPAEEPRRRSGPDDDLFAHGPVGYALLDRQGRIRQLTAPVARILGRDLAELEGRHLGALLEAGHHSVLLEHLRRALRAPLAPVVDELQVRTPRGPVWLRLETVLARAADNGEPRCRTALLDISAQRDAEHQLEGHRLALVRAARMALLGEVTATLSHHLSEPLTALSLYLSLAEAESQAGRGEQLGALLRKSGRQVQRATALLRRVRRLTRVRPTGTSSHDLALLVGRVLSYLEPQIRAAGVGICLRGPRLTVSGDRYQLEQVLLNLLRQSITSVQSTATVGRVDIIISRREPAAAEICIADNGAGLPEDPEELDALFAPLDSRTADPTALGLPISRALIEGNGGRLWAEPNRPNGARFVFSLPLATGA